MPTSEPDDVVNYVGECGTEGYLCGLCEGDCGGDSTCEGNMMDDPLSFESTKFKCSFRRLLYLHKLVGDALDSVVVAEFRMSLLKLVSSDLFRGSNKGVDAEERCYSNRLVLIQ